MKQEEKVSLENAKNIGSLHSLECLCRHHVLRNVDKLPSVMFTIESSHLEGNKHKFMLQMMLENCVEIILKSSR
jgi:hypothetical protein